MDILHAKTDPDLLTRLREMLRSADRADIAVGYFFVSGFAAVADDFSRLKKTRILVGRADRPTLESVAAGLRQAESIRASLEMGGLVQRSERERVELVQRARAGYGFRSHGCNHVEVCSNISPGANDPLDARGVRDCRAELEYFLH